MKALIIGLGGIGQRHARNLRALMSEDLEIVAYRSRRLARVITPSLQADMSRDVESELGIRAFPTLASALAERPQIAIICNPSSLHTATAIDCVQAGCDLFLEKPLSGSMEGVCQLAGAVERTKRVVMVGYQFRFHPCFRRLQEIIRDGLLGRLLAIRAIVGEYLPGWHAYEDYRAMYASRADLGGGVVLSQIHEFDYLYCLFGLPKRLFALGGHWSNLEIDVEDVASTLMEFNLDGRPLPVHLQQDYLQRPTSRSCEIIGDEGKVLIDFSALSVTRYDAGGKLAETRSWEGFDRNQLYVDELRHFLDCVETRRKPIVELFDGICSLRMALAVQDSIASGKVVEIAPNWTTQHA